MLFFSLDAFFQFDAFSVIILCAMILLLITCWSFSDHFSFHLSLEGVHLDNFIKHSVYVNR